MRKHQYSASLLTAFSALALGACSGGSSDGEAALEFSEIMYQGQGADSLEFIELHNTGDAALALAGLQITSGVEYTFSSTAPELKEGGYVVLTNNPTEFAARHPGVLVYGPYVGRLSNSGDELEAVAADSTTLAECSFGAVPPWASMANGGGYSLVFTGGDSRLASGWAASATAGGTPGAANSQAPSISVLVNEVYPAGNTTEGWIELYNNSSQVVDVSGWLVTASMSSMSGVTLASGTTIAANGYLVVTQSQWDTTAFPSMAGDKVYLIQKVNGATTGAASGLVYAALSAGQSAVLQTLSDGTVAYGATSSPTSGAANSAISVGPLVISEIMYHPLDNGSEFIEIVNVSSATVSLNNPLVSSSGWSVSGVGFAFPIGSSLASNAKVVIARVDTTDTASFRATNSIPASVPIYLFDKKLSNNGEELVLEQPLVIDTVITSSWSDVVLYGDSDPWPAAADGEGKSLQRVDLTKPGSDPAAWQAGTPTPGQ